MITVKYKTLRGFVSQLANNQYDLYDYINRRAYLKRRGWCNIELSEEAENQLLSGFASAIWQKVNTERVNRVRNANNMGILRRVIMTRRGRNISFEYCAGQDYPSEIRYIQRNI